jgi:HSP20 family protein
MNRLQTEMNRLFDRFGLEDGGRGPAPAFPALNLWEDADNLYLESELPGMKLEDLEIYVTGGNQLSLKGKREAPEVEKNAWHRRERSYAQFSRVVALPQEVDAEKVEAEFQHGVLCVKLPKHEASKPRRIEVKAES